MIEASAAATDAARFAAEVGPALLAMTRLAARLAPHADPDDIVQDAVVRAWTKWELFDPGRGTAMAWLLAITADQACAARRKRVRWLRVVDDRSAVPERAAAAPDLERDLDIERALRKLPQRQRLAVDCHYFVGLSVDETAAVMACSAGTVKSTLHDARRRLRDLLGDGDDLD